LLSDSVGKIEAASKENEGKHQYDQDIGTHLLPPFEVRMRAGGNTAVEANSACISQTAYRLTWAEASIHPLEWGSCQGKPSTQKCRKTEISCEPIILTPRFLPGFIDDFTSLAGWPEQAVRAVYWHFASCVVHRWYGYPPFLSLT
jgi:hypothetical protein